MSKKFIVAGWFTVDPKKRDEVVQCSEWRCRSMSSNNQGRRSNMAANKSALSRHDGEVT